MTAEVFVPLNIPTVLIVDDTHANLDILTGMLGDRGYEPRPVPSGKLALLSARADPPDLILLDIRMPEMDGFEVCRRLKADETLKDIPVIFITALSDTADKLKAFSLGAVDYVTKPFQVEEIDARVRAHLKISFLQRRLNNQNEHLELLVAERTRELTKAYERMVELDRLKDDFLRMITHEIRTPMQGILGIGELIIDLCPVSENCRLYAGMFRDSSLRLRNLIDDAALITETDKLTMDYRAEVSFSELLDSVKISLPGIKIDMNQPVFPDSVFLQGDYRLLKRALETVIQLAMTFSRDRQRVNLMQKVEALAIQLHIDLDALPLSQKAVDNFFKLESSVRASSPAQDLGLAPVSAHRIITAFGGELRLVKGESDTGHLEAVFRTVTTRSNILQK
ncbi:MAG: hybrid sensor histidine kinase/response regulator [Deltaproteobacteria bacterium]|nr:hybrid sensor histidine kinase/response regulator [Deltaproteobacteria bacterium]